MSIELTGINVFPLKSAAANQLTTAKLTPTGLLNDRHWMLVDPQGKAITAREFPALLKVNAEIRPQGISFSAGKRPVLNVSTASIEQNKLEVAIFSANCQATLVSDQADQWFSDYLSTPCRLVCLSADDHREVLSKSGGQAGDQVSFADQNPILLINQASIDALNELLAEPVTERNFRANLVVQGAEAFAEEHWQRIKIGDAEFRVAQLCKRCPLTTIDPDKAQYRQDKEPLLSLMRKRYNREAGGAMFGIHMIPLNTAAYVNLGDELIVLE